LCSMNEVEDARGILRQSGIYGNYDSDPCRWSTFVPRKATISWFATNPTRTFFANALKADRNHRFIREISFYDLQEFHFAGQISLYDLEISFNDRSHTATASGV